MKRRNTKNRHTRKYKKYMYKKGGKGMRTVRNKTMKTMSCSPMVEKKKVARDSCFTPEVLQLLKKYYNKHHPTTKIISDEPVRIWEELKNRLGMCSKEDCWLDEIEDKQVRKKIDEYIFAPDHPDSWKSDPDEWLSNFDIMDVLKQYMKTYPKFYAPPPSPIDYDVKPKETPEQCVSNELCKFHLEKHMKNGKTKFGIVFNVSPHTSGGSHWVSVFIDTDDKFIFYMDSAGNKIPKQINKFIETVKEQGLAMKSPIQFQYYENYPLEHQMGTTECGMFSLYFIITMLCNKAENRVFTNCNDKINFFKKKRIPDSYVFKFRKIYFNEK